MFANRFDVTLTLKTLTSLHVGTGEFKAMPAREGTNKAGHYAAIVRDYQGLAYLPATAIKGVVRRLAEDYFRGEAVIDTLFGTIKGSKAGSGAMGRLLFRAGFCSGKGLPNVDAMPFAKEAGAGAYIAARTAIDGASGVADDHKLFFQEMVPPGVTFSVSLTLLDFGQGDDTVLTTLATILSIAVRDGLALGKSQADGQGQMAVSDVAIRHMKLGDDGTLKETKKDVVRAAAKDVVPLLATQTHAFHLVCPMPFAVVDSSVKGAGREQARESGTVQVAAQKLRDGMPLVHGSSIAGVLRSRAVWLSRLMIMNKLLAAENRAVEDLFGTTDRRALLDIKDLVVSKAREEKITSLRVDRFTGAPVFGALFTTAAFTGVKLSFALVLKPRPGCAATKDANTLLARLVEDIRKNGLQLGHGTNKGFGWFKPMGGTDGA